jgi:hypothetical protein
MAIETRFDVCLRRTTGIYLTGAIDVCMFILALEPRTAIGGIDTPCKLRATKRSAWCVSDYIVSFYSDSIREAIA